MTRRSTRFPSPPRVSGTPRPRPWPAPPASTFTWKSRAATIPRRRSGSWRRRESTTASCKWARSAAPRATASTRLRSCTPAPSARSGLPNASIADNRPTIGTGRKTPVPEWLDYELWQGPAPRRPYQTNVIHNNWHLFWHYDGGELANNGVHYLDVAQWGLAVGPPRQVTCAGRRYRYRDDQETPDTGTATYDFGDIGISMEWSSCYPRGRRAPALLRLLRRRRVDRPHRGGAGRPTLDQRHALQLFHQ